ncbi:HlyD family efflux transporter periplasmic adaptor subunit [Butyrivibrio sp. VCD2006]|uniref:HlyD family efflux transporter periplasmic adaptor subunit n=1 Tax=Butyrivibrio sp. VCD2006 TaxID=1280664 RepID=UPI000413C993|nr:HlyD family efflux transporter periplasmic adaptor subunit [Butyrivibrio sp. VCD2006]
MKFKEILLKKKTRLIAITIAILMATVTVGTACIININKAKASAADMIPMVEIAEVTRQDIKKTISLNGTIAALDSQSVASELTGVKINSLKVRVGDRVKEGDVIAVLDTTSIEKSLAQAKEALEIAKKKDSLELATAQRNYDAAVETARIQIERAQREAEKADKAYNDAVTEAGTADAQNSGAVNDVNEKTAEASGAQDAVNNAASNAENSESKLANAKQAYDDANRTATEYESTISTLKTDYEAYTKGDFATASNRFNQASDALNSANNALKSAEEKKTALDGNPDANPEDVVKAQEELDKAKAAAQTAQGVYEEAQSNFNNAKEKLNGIQNSITQAEEDYKKAVKAAEKKEKKVDKAQKESDNAKKDLESKQQALENAQTNLSDAKSKQAETESDAKTAKETIKTAKDSAEKAKEEAEDQKRENDKSVADSKDSYSETQLGQGSNTVQAQQEVDKYEQDLEKATIIAPCDGLVTAVGVKEGGIYDNGNEIALIQNDSGYKVTATVDQYDICDIKEGMKVKIKTDSVDEEMDGTLTFVSPIPQGAAQSGSEQAGSGQGASGDYPIEVSIKSGMEDRLRIGMTAKITILEEESDNALTVPDNCVQTAEDGSLYIEKAGTDENGNLVATGERIVVTYGVKTDYYVEIKGVEIEEGMSIIVPSSDDFGSTGDETGNLEAIDFGSGVE